jgi:hypothetical protein
MAESRNFDAASGLLPSGFYEHIAPFLHLCGMACLQFFSRPYDPLPREITELTGLDLASARMVTAINSDETLARQLLEEPETFYVHLLVGHLVLGGPLAEPVLRFVQKRLHLDGLPLDEVRTTLLPFGAKFMALVARFAVGDDAREEAALQQLHRQIKDAFARLGDTLRAVELPEPAAPPPVAEAPAWPTGTREPALAIRLQPEQLQMLQLSVAVVQALPLLSTGALAQALPTLKACPPAGLVAVADRLAAAKPDAVLTLTWPEAALLYQTTQVLAMALVSTALDVLNWEERLSAQATDRATLITPEDLQQRQQTICLMIEHFVRYVQDQLPDEPRLEPLRRETQALADLL